MNVLRVSHCISIPKGEVCVFIIRLTDWLLVGRFSFVNMSHQCLMTKFGYFTKLFVKFYMSATIGDAQNRKQNLTNAKKTLLSLSRAYRLSRYCSCVNTPPLSRLVQFDSRIVWGLFVLVYYKHIKEALCKLVDFHFASFQNGDQLLKVGSWSFKGIIILLIYFLNCRKPLFTKK